MRKLIIFSFTSWLALLSSCGPSATEIAAKQKHMDDSITSVNKHHDDSLANAVRLTTIRNDDSIASAKHQAQENKQKLEIEFSQIRTELEQTNAELSVAYDQMNHIKQFQLGRAQSEREKQIRNQSMRIQQLQDRITSLRGDMNRKQSALAEVR